MLTFLREPYSKGGEAATVEKEQKGYPGITNHSHEGNSCGLNKIFSDLCQGYPSQQSRRHNTLELVQCSMKALFTWDFSCLLLSVSPIRIEMFRIQVVVLFTCLGISEDYKIADIQSMNE